MNISRPLSGCTIAGALKVSTQPFGAVASSLLYQSNALGMQLELDTTAQALTDKQISFIIKTPHTLPVTCDILGWADHSTDLLTENIVQAASGMMSVHGRASGRAQPLGLNYVSTLASALALQGGFAASIGQLRGASTSRSTVSLTSAALFGMGLYIAMATAPDSPDTTLPGATSPKDRPPFVSADGVVFELEALNVEPWRMFWAEVGVDADSAGKGWGSFLPRYARAIAPMPTALTAALSRLPYARIVEISVRTNMSICPVRSINERAQDDDVQNLWRQGPWEFIFGPSQHKVQSSRIIHGLPLSGLKVVESCRRIQGPIAGHLLASLGAEVIRIESPGGDPQRGMPPMVDGCSVRFHALNRNKSEREIDIKSLQGRAEIHELVRHADVFLHNWAPGKATSLHLDYPDLARINPSLIYAYAGAWGTMVQHALPGTDYMAQAYSGIAQKIADASCTLGGTFFTILDILGGVVAAQGVTAALLKRCMHHAGSKVNTSLLSAATLLCADDLHALFHPNETSQTAPSTINAVYQTKQGLIAIECYDTKTLARLAEALDFPITEDKEHIHAKVSESLLSKTAEEWSAVFKKCGIPAAIVVEDLSDLQKDQRIKPCLNVGSYMQVNSPWSFK